MVQEVVFEKKLDEQKNGCINCLNKSVLEAVCDNVRIPCCENEKCKEIAAEAAKDIASL